MNPISSALILVVIEPLLESNSFNATLVSTNPAQIRSPHHPRHLFRQNHYPYHHHPHTHNHTHGPIQIQIQIQIAIRM
ncbi:hypothetical protein J3Q64DRAFT_1713229 [Phycomyces blakesleeanus]|uniref:Secreted protein n=1 Tax=Phycomyces blakesleeanus TaxID=4837 RepID=A0ABR3BEV8_PHYBL